MCGFFVGEAHFGNSKLLRSNEVAQRVQLLLRDPAVYFWKGSGKGGRGGYGRGPRDVLGHEA